ncbi:MAG: tRNA (adenosine(37)-N6)-threonylcarbamoyltransferase complex dimerization subunit type 1 TsaB [Pseudomonadota bacterium]
MRPDPTILVFDTSAAHCAAALLLRGKIVAQRHEDMKKGQAERLFPMLDEVLGEVGTVWNELDAIGVGVGPGNFTGLRIAVSAAHGLSLSLGIRAIGISSFELMRGALEGDGQDEIVSMPAPRQHAYLQTFRDGKAEAPRLVELSTASLGAEPRKRPDIPVIGYEAALIAFGLTAPDAARADDPYQGSNGVDCDIDNWAETLARLTEARFAQSSEHRPPTPLYVRPPDAAPASDPPPVILP